MSHHLIIVDSVEISTVIPRSEPRPSETSIHSVHLLRMKLKTVEIEQLKIHSLSKDSLYLILMGIFIGF